MEPNWLPKWSQKAIKNRLKKWCIFWSKHALIFYEKMEPTGSPKGPKIKEKLTRFRPLLPEPLRECKMEPKWPQNGLKMGSKYTPNGARIEWKISETSSRNICVFWWSLSGFQTFSRWFHQTFYRMIATFLGNSWGLPLKFVRNSFGMCGGKSCGNPQGIHWNWWGICADVAGNSSCLSGGVYGIKRELAGGTTGEIVWK